VATRLSCDRKASPWALSQRPLLVFSESGLCCTFFRATDMLSPKHPLHFLTSAIQKDGTDSSRSIVSVFDSKSNSETSTHQPHYKATAAVFSVCRCCSSACGWDAQAQRQQ